MGNWGWYSVYPLEGAGFSSFWISLCLLPKSYTLNLLSHKQPQANPCLRFRAQGKLILAQEHEFYPESAICIKYDLVQNDAPLGLGFFVCSMSGLDLCDSDLPQ